MNEELKRRMSTKKVKTQYRVFVEYKNGGITSAGTTSSLADHQDTRDYYQGQSDEQMNDPRFENPIVKVHPVTQTIKYSDWNPMP